MQWLQSDEMSIDAEIEGALLTEPWFNEQIARVGPLIAQHGRVQSFRRGEVIYQSGDPPSGMFLVLDGAVRLYHYSFDGREALVGLHDRGRWFGELSEVDGLDRTHTAIAGQATRVLMLSSDKLRLILAACPEFSGFLTQLLALHLRAALAIIIERRELSPAAQVARVLIAAVTGDAERSHCVTQSDLAAMVGVSRQTISKVLHGFRDDGLVELRYRQVRVLEPVRLERIAYDLNC